MKIKQRLSDGVAVSWSLVPERQDSKKALRRRWPE